LKLDDKKNYKGDKTYRRQKRSKPREEREGYFKNTEFTGVEKRRMGK